MSKKWKKTPPIFPFGTNVRTKRNGNSLGHPGLVERSYDVEDLHPDTYGDQWYYSIRSPEGFLCGPYCEDELELNEG